MKDIAVVILENNITGPKNVFLPLLLP